MSAHNSLVATYANHSLAKIDIHKLQSAGFDMRKLSVIVQNQHGIAGKLGGAMVASSLGELEETRYGCIPEDDLVDYESELKAGRLILVAHGTADEITRAKSVTDSTHVQSWDGIADCAVYYGCAD